MQMEIETRVTNLKSEEEVMQASELGAYVHGLFLEGAAWESGSVAQEGYLIEQKPKDLHPRLPVINCVAVLTEQKRV